MVRNNIRANDLRYLPYVRLNLLHSQAPMTKTVEEYHASIDLTTIHDSANYCRLKLVLPPPQMHVVPLTVILFQKGWHGVITRRTLVHLYAGMS